MMIFENMCFLFLDLGIVINFSMVLIDINSIIKYYTTVQKFVSFNDFVQQDAIK